MSYPSDGRLRNAALQIAKEAIAARSGRMLPLNVTADTETMHVSAKAILELMAALKAVQQEIQNATDAQVIEDRINPQAPAECGPFVFAPLPRWMGPGNPG